MGSAPAGNSIWFILGRPQRRVPGCSPREADPWMKAPMRKTIGLPSAGAQLLAKVPMTSSRLGAAPEVILGRLVKSKVLPTVPLNLAGAS